MNFKLGKTYKTRDGRKASIWQIEGDALYPIKANVTNEDGMVTSFSYKIDGTSASNHDQLDLIFEEEQMEQAQPLNNIIEAHGTKWEVTHSVSSEDMVKKPNHKILFADEELGIEINNIQVIASALTHEQFTGFILGQIMDYRFRAGKKWDKLEEDVKKADYLMELYHKYKRLTTDWGLVKQ